MQKTTRENEYPSRITVSDDNIERAKKPHALLRRLLLWLGAFLFLAVVTIIAIYNFGRINEIGNISSGETSATRPAPSTSAGLDYVQTSDGLPVFRVRAESSSQIQQDRTELNQATFDFFRDREILYSITSDNAVISQETLSAVLEGNVLITGLDQLKLQARKLKFASGGAVLESEGPIELWYPPNIEGRANHMALDRATNTVILDGGVHLRTEPSAVRALKLESDKVAFTRNESLIRASGNVQMDIDSSRLTAEIISLALDETETAERGIRSVRARGNVATKLMALSPSGQNLVSQFKGDTLAIEKPESSSAYAIELNGTPDEMAEITYSDDEGQVYTYRGTNFLAHATPDFVPISFSGFGDPLRILSHLDLRGESFPLRSACANRLEGRFNSSGELEFLMLRDAVSITDQELQVTGAESATFDQKQGNAQFTGHPVTIVHSMGEIFAPRLQYSQHSGLLEAKGGISAVLNRNLQGRPSEQTGPTRISADEGIWNPSRSELTLVGNAKAWRDRNTLTANQMRYQLVSEAASASGGVRVTLFQEIPGIDNHRQTLIEAGSLVNEGLTVEFSTEVIVDSEDYQLACDQLDTRFRDETYGSLETALCTGNVQLLDRSTGSKAAGHRARYDIARRQIEMVGNPVRLIDGSNNQLTGEYLVYDLATGKARIHGKAPTELN